MKLKFIFTLFLFINLILISCESSKRVYGNSEKWMPEGFKPAKTILLIEKYGNRRVRQKMEDHMMEKYPYKYEFVIMDTIKKATGKYADTTLYKYALVISRQDGRITRMGGASTNIGLPANTYDLNFYDRSLQKNYRSTQRPSGDPSVVFMGIINTILKKYE